VWQKVSETEQQMFCKTLFAGKFLLGAQSLVKSTPGVNLTNIGTCVAFFARTGGEAFFRTNWENGEQHLAQNAPIWSFKRW